MYTLETAAKAQLNKDLGWYTTISSVLLLFRLLAFTFPGMSCFTGGGEIFSFDTVWVADRL